MEYKQEHTLLVSVLFIDIVGYSKTSMAHQKLMKDFLNQAISRGIESVAPTDRVILDTGDGAAICFLSDPEMAVQAAVSIRKSLINRPNYAIETIVRMGLNLGPVRLVEDINGRMNAVGEGINIGQRIMSFATQDYQIAASRPYVEMISYLGDEYKEIFLYEGMRKDKHGREHAVYMVKDSLGGNSGATIQISPDAIEKIGLNLAELVGPIARLLIKRHQPGVSSHRMLVEKLASEIEDDIERGKFVAAVEDVVQQYDAVLNANKTDSAAGTMRADYSPQPVDSNMLNYAERTLASYIGPVAKVLIKEVAARTRNSKEFYEGLANYVTDPASQRAFLDKLLSSDESRKAG